MQVKKIRFFFDFWKKRLFWFFIVSSLLVINLETTIAETISLKNIERARYHSNLGSYFWQKGDYNQAISAWLQEAEVYRLERAHDLEAETMLKIAQTYIDLGQTESAIFQLKKVLSLTGKSSLKARAWNQLGNAYSRDGKLDLAFSAYAKSFELEKNLSTLNNLVGLQQKQALTFQLQANSAIEGKEKQYYLSQAKIALIKAQKYAESALLLSKNEVSPSSLRALIQWSKLWQKRLSRQQIERGRDILANLPSSRAKVFLGINWAKLDVERADYWIGESAKVAKVTEDSTAKSYIFLELGLLAEKSAKIAKAAEYARMAISLALLDSNYDALYRAYWLLGRINQYYGNKEVALDNYQNAIVAFENLNQALTNINIEQRLNFSSQVEPMYRTALELLLEDSLPSQSNLQQSLLIFEKLQLSQLQSFFGDNCFELEPSYQTQNVAKSLKRKNVVKLYSIILKERTHLILQLPDGKLSYSNTDLGKKAITALAKDWYKSMAIDSTSAEDFLNRNYSQNFWQQAEKLYSFILRPFERELEQIKPDTLVFIHDGILRNLPMAALFDGDKFVAQKWASISSIGINFKRANREQSQAKVLAFGLEESRNNWSNLYFVPEEIQNILNIVRGKKFIDREFTSDKFYEQSQKRDYSILHFATHGYFGGVAENSFILAHDKSLNALDIEKALIDSSASIRLLVFSACETALSSERSILGLAGVALRSGIDYVMGSFWPVQDREQSELIEEFYALVYQKKMDEAIALQEIQLRQIERKAHPSSWAALNLIGNFHY